MSDSEPDPAAVDRHRLRRRRAAGADRRAARRRRRARRRGGRGGPLRPRRRPGRPSPRRCSRPSTATDGVQRRATLELWTDGEDGQPLRGAGTLISSRRVAAPRPRLRDRLLPLVGRGPRGPRPLRGRARRCLMRPRSRRSISDFGGVLTTPLIESFMAFQDETGITTEDLGKAMQAVDRGQRRQPALRDGAGRDHRGRLPRAAHRRARAAARPPAARCTASKRSTSRRCDPNPPMIELMRELKDERLPDGDADQQRARVGAALALDAAGRRDLRDRRRLRLRRLPQARIADLRDHPGADRPARPRPASSSTTSRSTAKARARPA